MHTPATKEAKAILVRVFPAVKWSVRKLGYYGALFSVSWTDGPHPSEVAALLGLEWTDHEANRWRFGSSRTWCQRRFLRRREWQLTLPFPQPLPFCWAALGGSFGKPMRYR